MAETSGFQKWEDRLNELHDQAQWQFDEAIKDITELLRAVDERIDELRAHGHDVIIELPPGVSARASSLIIKAKYDIPIRSSIQDVQRRANSRPAVETHNG